MTPAVAAVLVLAAAAALRAARRATARSRASARLPVPSARAAGTAPSRAADWLAPRLAQLDVAVSPSTVWAVWLALMAGALVLGLMAGGPGLAVLAWSAVTTTPAIVWRLGRRRAEQRLEARLPLALDAVGRGLRSGAGLHQALSEAATAVGGTLGAELGGVAAAANAVGVVAALEEWSHHRPLPGARLAVAALCLGVETGGAQARAVDGVAATLRQRLATAAEARALASQARASAAVIGVAPVGFCALASATDPRVSAFLLRSAGGLAVLAIGLLLDGLGAIWMVRLARLDA